MAHEIESSGANCPRPGRVTLRSRLSGWVRFESRDEVDVVQSAVLVLVY